jgi:parvulin-like peptidyl-prolyl isomerase
MGILVCLGSCRRETSKRAVSPPQRPVLAVVNGREVSQADFEDYLRLKEIEQEGAAVEPPRTELFRQFIEEQLLLDAAAQEGVVVSDEELRERLPEGVSPEEKERVRDYLRIQKFVRARIGPQSDVSIEEMQRYYRDHQGEFVVDDRARVLEILMSDEAVAKELRKKMKPGDFYSFRQTARRHSRGLTAEQGGELGTFERGELPEEFEKVVFPLKPGAISNVFHTSHGYHIFMMEEFIPRHTQPFREVQRVILEKLIAQRERVALERYLDELVAKASIEVRDPKLKFERRSSNAESG